MKNTKTVKNPAVFRHAWGLKCTHGGLKGGCLPLEVGFEGAQPLATFWNLHGFRVPRNDVLALDEVQTVLYTHGLNERQSLPKKAKVAAILWLQFRNGSGQLSGYDMPRNVDPSVKKGCWFETVSVQHAVETCTRN